MTTTSIDDTVLGLLSNATDEQKQRIAALLTEVAHEPAVEPEQGNAVEPQPRPIELKQADAPSPLDLGLSVPEKPKASSRMADSVAKGARWTTKRGKPQPCYDCTNRRDEDQDPKAKVIKAGERMVYWPFFDAEGKGQALFFHPKCWGENSQYSEATGLPISDPEPVVVLTAKQAKAKDEQASVMASQLAGGVPQPRSAADIFADTIKEAAIVRAYTPPPTKLEAKVKDLGTLAQLAQVATMFTPEVIDGLKNLKPLMAFMKDLDFD